MNCEVIGRNPHGAALPSWAKMAALNLAALAMTRSTAQVLSGKVNGVFLEFLMRKATTPSVVLVVVPVVQKKKVVQLVLVRLVFGKKLPAMLAAEQRFASVIEQRFAAVDEQLC